MTIAIPRVDAHVLLVDDRAENRHSTGILLSRSGCAVDEADGVPQALARLRTARFDVVLTDVRMEHEDDGIELLRLIKAEWPAMPVILYTGWPDSDDAVRAIKLGAEDYLHLPGSPEAILGTVRAAATNHRTAVVSTDGDLHSSSNIVAASPAMKAALQWVARIAPTDAAVLIVGETGTGKELIARAIHAGSRRSKGPFVAVNCGAIPPGFVEAELFGYRKGAFTSAVADKPGLAEEADRGSLFLDEVGELPLEMQASLLRFLDTGEFRRLGENKLRRVDPRIISATNRPLAKEMDNGRFRADLYFRLNVATCTIPPLRSRPEDIEALVHQWNLNGERKLGVCVTSAGMARLLAHEWPGNVRELRSVLERAALLASGQSLDELEIQSALHGGGGFYETAATSVANVEDDDERDRIHRALANHHWHLSRTAASLGISRWTLRRRLRDLGLCK